MSDPEQPIIFPDVTVVSSNTTDYKVCGNPDLVERVDIQAKSKSPNVQAWVYGYVDPTTNTYIHSHEMEVKKGSFL